MSEQKTCKQCDQSFIIEEEDLEFYNKISPTFNGEKYQIPVPTLCPNCRQQRRLSFRNERNLYNRKCDLTGKQIISIYSPDKPYKVYDQEAWWSDKWDPLEYGKEFDFSRPFFDQFKELQVVVPRVSLTNTNSENSEYTNYTANNKNCYLIFSNSYGHNENCYYGTCLSKSKNCVDSINIFDCELTFDCIDCTNCYHLFSSRNCVGCSDSYFLSDCRQCNHCLACKGLRGKQYCILNEQYSKEEYEKKLAESDLYTHAGYDKMLKIFNDFDKKTPHLFTRQINCENCTGDYLQNSKDCLGCFDTNKSEHCKYLQYSVGDDNYCYDSSYLVDSEYCYENMSLVDCNHLLFTNLTWWGVSNSYYSDLCFNNSHDLFGCVGLKKKEYCILNKQYTKDEYEELVPKIIEHMKKGGEWGEFFPMSLSPFGYNETIAQEYFPLEKDDAEKRSAKWQDQDFSMKYDGPFYEPKDIKEYINNEEERKNILAGILKCEVSGKPFKIVPGELAFYIENEIPIPTKHSDVRHREQQKLRNPRKLYHRECMCEETGHDHEGHCKNEFETTYASDRPEKVYCETCYQKSIL